MLLEMVMVMAMLVMEIVMMMPDAQRMESCITKEMMVVMVMQMKSSPPLPC